MQTNLGEGFAAAKVAVQDAIDHSDIDLNMWDACTDDGVPPEAEARHARLKLALALLGDDIKPAAWSCELATHLYGPDGAYGGWQRRLSEHAPHVPKGSVRNVVALYGAAS